MVGRSCGQSGKPELGSNPLSLANSGSNSTRRCTFNGRSGSLLSPAMLAHFCRPAGCLTGWLTGRHTGEQGRAAFALSEVHLKICAALNYSPLLEWAVSLAGAEAVSLSGRCIASAASQPSGSCRAAGEMQAGLCAALSLWMLGGLDSRKLAGWLACWLNKQR